ncbi:MAG: beta-ketoacyl-ACP synthase III [Deferribacterota bacterium]|nr:beta-ketoacyl-ACP synthase III [Deferribacterota bacterium]
MFSKIAGTGSCFPKKILTNKDFENMVDTSDEWIVSRTGIKERRVVNGESTLDLAYEASLKALESAGLKSNQIDGIVCASITQDTIMPSLSCSLQAQLGIGGKSFAYDVIAACSGFIYAAANADSLIKTGIAKKILVVGAERLSVVTDYTDRSTCVLFGDGAGAVILEASNTPGFIGFDLVADGSISDLLTLESLGTKLFENKEKYDIKNNLIKMKGNELFKIATKAMMRTSKKVLEKNSLTLKDIDYIIPHQANIRIIEMLAKMLKFPLDNVIITIDRYGNTSAASIPSTIDVAIEEKRIKKGDKILITSFGGGITWGAACFVL